MLLNRYSLSSSTVPSPQPQSNPLPPVLFCTVLYCTDLCTEQHCAQMSTPLLTTAHVGCAAPQSAHTDSGCRECDGDDPGLPPGDDENEDFLNMAEGCRRETDREKDRSGCLGFFFGTGARAGHGGMRTTLFGTGRAWRRSRLHHGHSLLFLFVTQMAKVSFLLPPPIRLISQILYTLFRSFFLRLASLRLVLITSSLALSLPPLFPLSKPAFDSPANSSFFSSLPLPLLYVTVKTSLKVSSERK